VYVVDLGLTSRKLYGVALRILRDRAAAEDNIVDKSRPLTPAAINRLAGWWPIPSVDAFWALARRPAPSLPMRPGDHL
jgi:hypothetical protein